MPAKSALPVPLRALPSGVVPSRPWPGRGLAHQPAARSAGGNRLRATWPPSAKRWLRHAALAALLAPALGAQGAGPALPAAAPPGPAATTQLAAPAPTDTTAEPDWAARSRAMERARLAVVGVAVQAVEGARSARTLGAQRRGSGVLISDDGLVLTIGYLLVEADTVDLSLPDGREVPARVRAVDAATGLGLVQALTPTGLTPVPLAAWAGPAAAHGAGGATRWSDRPLVRSTALSTDRPADRAAAHPIADPTAPAPHDTPAPAASAASAAPASPGAPPAVTMVSGGPGGDLNTTQVLGLAPFAGTWEYQIDRALLTHPPLPQHSGAALFNQRGELVGVGSLLLQDVSALLSGGAPAPASASGRRVPGNLFVPADLLPPILGELQAQGRSQASARAWLGLQCTEDAQGLQVLRVNDDSPADVAGLQTGDRVLRLDGQAVHTLAGLWQRLWAGGAAERPVQLDILREGLPMTLTVHSVDRDKTWRRPVGI